MFFKSMEVISDKFEPVKMIYFWQNSGNSLQNGGKSTKKGDFLRPKIFLMSCLLILNAFTSEAPPGV